MQGIDTSNDGPRVTVESPAGTPVPPDQSVRRAADHASKVAQTLSAAGYQPRHLSVTFSETGDLVLVARLDAAPATVQPPTVTPTPRPEGFPRVSPAA